jgi:hypothetical protein
MAHAPEIPAAALASIARQIGSRLPRPPAAPGRFAAAEAPPAEIGESFPVYMLGVDAIRDRHKGLVKIARPTGVWHHQIRYGAQALDIASSLGPPPGAAAAPGAAPDWQVQEVVQSPAAPRIDAAIAWIDKNVPGDPVANLLVVPAFYLTAFWLHDPNSDNVVIADMPPRLGALQPLTLYSSEEFLGRLADLKPLSGVPRD